MTPEEKRAPSPLIWWIGAVALLVNVLTWVALRESDISVWIKLGIFAGPWVIMALAHWGGAPPPQEDPFENAAPLREMHHRIRNNLQLIGSILSLELRDADHEATRAALERIQARFLALAAVHQQHGTEEAEQGVDMPLLLNPMIRKLLPDHPGLELHVAPVRLDMDQAIQVALFFGEVASALDGTQPTLLSFVKEDAETMRIEAETFVLIGPPESASGRLLEALARQLNSQLVREDTATPFRLSLRFARG